MFVWFSRPVELAALLEKWGQPPSNYDPNEPIDRTWHIDSYEKKIGTTAVQQDAPGLFERATERLFQYDFYPPEVLQAFGDYSLAGRGIRFGDRIVQRIHVIPRVLDVIVMNRIEATFYEPTRRGFTYHSTQKHLAMGEWTAAVVQKKSGDISLMVHSISKPAITGVAHPFARFLQLRAHRLGTQHFLSGLKDD